MSANSRLSHISVIAEKFHHLFLEGPFSGHVWNFICFQKLQVSAISWLTHILVFEKESYQLFLLKGFSELVWNFICFKNCKCQSIPILVLFPFLKKFCHSFLLQRFWTCLKFHLLQKSKVSVDSFFVLFPFLKKFYHSLLLKRFSELVWNFICFKKLQVSFDSYFSLISIFENILSFIFAEVVFGTCFICFKRCNC